jgi:hypothetical protein
MRYIFFLFLTLSLFITQSVFADDLVLTQIGGMATQGKKFNQWWYEPQRVILKGTGSKAANIDVTLDGKFNTIRSSEKDGSWTYDLGTLAIADHSVVVGSGDQSYSFILTIGSSPPANMSDTKGGLPTAGGFLPLIGLISIAGGLIYFGLRKSES